MHVRGGKRRDATRRERAVRAIASHPDLIAAAYRGKHGSLSFASSIFSTSAVMFLVLKMIDSGDSPKSERTSCLGTRATVRGREEDGRPAHTSRSRLDTNPEASPGYDVTKKTFLNITLRSTLTYDAIIITSPSSPRVPSSSEPSAR